MMSRPILEQMTMWGQHYDQQVQALRRAQDRAAAKGELVPLQVIEDHQTDMESLADQAANLLSTIHAMLDQFVEEVHTGNESDAVDGLLISLEGSLYPVKAGGDSATAHA
jgi:hypothetical protein